MTHPPCQPFLHDAIAALHAPTQVWSGRDGEIGNAPIEGVYHGDLQYLRALRLEVSGAAPEAIGHAALSAGLVRFEAVARGLDDRTPDPLVRLTRHRAVEDSLVRETVTISSAREVGVAAEVAVRMSPSFTALQQVKAGLAGDDPWEFRERASGIVAITSGTATIDIEAYGATVAKSGDEVIATWLVEVPARGSVDLEFQLRLADTSMVVRGAPEWSPAHIQTTDQSARRWLQRASDDLGALRLTLPSHPEDAFFAAGAPWFLTLFGRDSIWAARLALPLAPDMARSTLRVLARLQGETVDPATAEAPGKILHELRSADLEMPGEEIRLPPRYFGTVDATPLWVCLLADAREAGLPDDEVRALLPALRGALDWLLHYGAASKTGFIDYIDETGTGLANQGWKDSGDSIQWRDGTLAVGPIALCEVQGYAYEAATRGADLLEAMGEDGADELRDWAAALKQRFHDSFWVFTEEGTYPAIALDAHGRAVDSLTSNIGHLIGTGLLEADEERLVADLLIGSSMASGYGIRTLSTRAEGYWPLGYHRGSVWPHDTAIIVRAMLRAGFVEHASLTARQLLQAAERFDYRMPELQSGDSADEAPVPVPYPASCRPQAWAAAAAVVCAEALT